MVKVLFGKRGAEDARAIELKKLREALEGPHELPWETTTTRVTDQYAK